MERHDEAARKLFLEGCSCAQAVLAAFAPEVGLSQEQALRLASSFGGGMGGLRETCGAVSGMLLAVGLLYGYDDVENLALKRAHYARVRLLAERFREENGSILCRELLAGAGQAAGEEPSARTAAYYKKRPCAELVACAARLLEDHMAEHPPVLKEFCG